MGLALPLALAGLLLVAIPLWLHRVRRKLLREQPLPTLILLQRAVAQKRRTIHFRDRPLLIARIVMIALSALALSQPFLSRIASYATERPIALALVLDDSMSMSRNSKGLGTLFERAVSRGRSVIDELAKGSEAVVVMAGTTPRVIAGRTSDLEGARRALANADEPVARGTALEPALGLALRELAASKLSVREVLVLTDCAAHGAPHEFVDRENVRVECLSPEKTSGNVFIEQVRRARASDKDDKEVISVVVAGSTKKNPVPVALSVDGTRLDTSSVTLENGRGIVDIEVKKSALLKSRTLHVRLGVEDAIAADNVRDMSLDQKSELSVLLVDGDPAPSQRDDELRFVALALDIGDKAHPPPVVTRIDPDAIASADLERFDVIVLANVPAPSESDAQRIATRVAHGAGLLIAAGDHIDPFAYRGRFGSLLPALIRSAAQAQPSLSVAGDNAERHSLLPEGAVGLETGRTTERLLVEPVALPSKVILSFDDGTPLLIAGKHEHGHVALLTTTLDDDWTDLPLTPGFVPLMHGIVRGLFALEGFPEGPHEAGTRLTARSPEGARTLFTVTPDGRRLDLDTSAPTIRLTDTGAPGVYRTFAAFPGRGERELPQFSFEIVPSLKDSDLTPAKMPKNKSATKLGSVGHPKSIAPWMWLLFGLSAVAEGILRLLRKPSSAQAA